MNLLNHSAICALGKISCRALLVGTWLLFSAEPAPGQVAYQKIKDFGIADVMGAEPVDALLLGSDGFLYGVTAEGGTRDLGTIFKLKQDGTGYQVIHHFGIGNDGRVPRGGLIETGNGFLYGTTSSGPSPGMGVIYRIRTDGSGYAIVHQFDGKAGGSQATGRLIQGPDGALYGTTTNGGTDPLNNSGLAYRFEPTSSNFAVLHFFSSSDGRQPSGALLEGSDGALYGTTSYGGNSDNGVVFRLGHDGSAFSVLRVFSRSDNQGRFPNELIEGSDGLLYGTTSYGGGTGKIFKLSKTGSGFVSYNLPASGPMNPYAPLVEGDDGFLYGTTYAGGSYHEGAIFRIAKNGTSFTTIHEFGAVTNDGESVFSPLIRGPAGILYGIARGGQSASGVIFEIDTTKLAYYILKQFSFSGGDAANPATKLVEGVDGQFYGVAERGGANGAGAIFRLSSNGTQYELLHELVGSTEGARPTSLLSGADGMLYGTAFSGGTSNSGTVFRFATNGDLTVLHSFAGAPVDGAAPNSLTLGTDGFLYGTTESGGSSNLLGCVFKLSRDGNQYRVLVHSGSFASDAARPFGLIEASDGLLYGVSQRGVTNYTQKIFRLDKNGANYRVLLEPPLPVTEILGTPQLLEGSDGLLYGTHANGGAAYTGSIYRLRKDGTSFAVLHDFAEDGSEGWWPKAGLMESANGMLYGTASYQGAGGGTVFRIAKDGTGFSVVYSFGSNTNDGAGPGPLIQGRDGRLYGACNNGGDFSLGTVFQVTTLELTQVTAGWSNGLPQVQWNAINGVRYRLEWTPNLSTRTWTSVPEDVVAEGPNGFKTDNQVTGAQRFYRIVVLPP